MVLIEKTPPLPITIAAAAEGQTLIRDGSGQFRNRRIPFWDITWSGAVAYPAGTAYASMTDSSAAILSAVATAKALGVPVVGAGTYRVDGVTVTLDDNADLGAATFVPSDTTIAPLVRIGTSSTSSANRVRRKRIIAPRVEQAAKSGTGWTGTSVGIEIANCYNCRITIPYAQGFTIGVLLTAYGSNGCVNNKVLIDECRNNKVNLKLAPADTSGWVNENTFYGGGLAHESTEGSNVSGVRDILLEAANGGNVVNNNRFHDLNLEGNTPEYHVELIGAAYNYFIYDRWEASPPKVWFNQTAGGQGSTDNLIFYGYKAENISITESAASQRNHRYSRTMIEVEMNGGADGAMVIANSSSSSNPVLVGLQAGDSSYQVDPATAYTFAIGANQSLFKRAADAWPRIKFDHVNGRVYFGNSGADPTMYLGNFGAIGLQSSTYFKVGTAASLPTPSANYRGMEIRIEGGTGVADGLYVCLKKSDDSYKWFNVLTGAEV